MNFLTALVYLKGILFSKTSYVFVSILCSFSLSVLMEQAFSYIETQQATLPLLSLTIILIVNFTFIFLDMITGIIASRKEGQPIKSSKWSVTVSKYFGIILYTCLASIVLVLFSSHLIVQTLVFGPILLATIREYISIGENLERIQGKKVYVFLMVDKIFDILERKFFSDVSKKLGTNKKQSE